MFKNVYNLVIFSQVKIRSSFYRIYPKDWDTLTPYLSSPKIWITSFDNHSMCLKLAGWVTLIRRRVLLILIWVYTVCSGLSGPIFRVITVILFQKNVILTFTLYYSRTSIARKSWKSVLEMGSSSHWGLIIVPGKEAYGANRISFHSFKNNGMLSVFIRIASIRRF